LICGETFVVPTGLIPRHNEEVVASRLSSFPYLSGDTFRAACDFCIDERQIPFDPEMINDGDTIFLSGYALYFFFLVIHPKIKKHYILVTHNSDESSPGKFEPYLDDEKIIAWFGHNSSIAYHPKFFPIPIGLANFYWPYGNVNIVHQERMRGFSEKKTIILYMNIVPGTNMQERRPVWELFSKKSFCATTERKSFQGYIQDLKRSHFVVSPPGHGLDCYRHWESMLMGAIPIIKHSNLDPLFEDLPAVLIDDWNEVTLDFLYAMHEKLASKKFNFEKLFAPYWFDKIKEVKIAAQQKYQQVATQ
jgi:hypothetical protein